LQSFWAKEREFSAGKLWVWTSKLWPAQFDKDCKSSILHTDIGKFQQQIRGFFRILFFTSKADVNHQNQGFLRGF
jgi:hypothetical protein